MTLRLITAPDRMPVTVEEMQEHLNIDSEDDDLKLDAYLRAATELFDGRDGWLSQALMPQTWEYAQDAFPCQGYARIQFWGGAHSWEIRIPLSPIISVTSVTYLDGDGIEQTIDAANYTADIISNPPRIVPLSTYSWPTAGIFPNAVRVRFVAGYADAVMSDPATSTVPANIKVAIMMTVAHYYGNRGDDAAVPQMEIPQAAKFLLRRSPVFA